MKFLKEIYCLILICNFLDVQRLNLYGRNKAYPAKHLVAMHTQCKYAILNIELTH